MNLFEKKHAWILGGFEYLHADDVVANAGSGGATFRTDQLAGGQHVPFAKLMSGTADDTAVIPGDATNGLYVQVKASAAVPVTDNGGTLSIDDGAGSITIDAASLPLPTGAATAAKQPALGTAGSASTDVITVQGIASMTALKVDGSAVTQPVSDGGGNLSVDDGAGSLTVDAPVGTPVFVRLSDGSSAISTLPVSMAAGATTPAKAEDAAHSSGDVGNYILGVRQDADTSPVSADGDYHGLIFNAIGRLKCSILPATTAAGTGNIATSTATVVFDCSRQGGCSIQIAGTFAGFNGTFEVSNDGGTTYAAVLATRSNSATQELTTGVLSANPGYLWIIPTFGCTNVRLRATALTSGTVAVTIMPSALVPVPAVAASQAGTWNVTNISGTVSLPTGAATAAKQPALGTAGSPSTDVITVQGSASGTALPVSLASVPSHAVTNAGTFAVQAGQAAHDAAQTGNPVRVAGRGRTSDYTAVANDDTTDFITDLNGKQIVLPYAIPENSIDGTTAAITGTTDTAVIAASGAGIRNYITHILVTNSHATVGTVVEIKDGSTVKYRGYAAPAGGGFSVPLPVPLRLTANTALNAANVTTGSNTYVSASGFKAP
jgi:hypothetical protein